MRNTCLNTIYDLAKKDDRVVFIGSDLGAGVLSDFKKNIPNRFLMEGISEQYITDMTVGLSMVGLIPYFNTISTFLTRRNFEQNMIGLGLHNSNVRLIGNGGGLVYAPLGPTHLSIDDIALMNLIPNMSILTPCDSNEMKHLMLQTLDWKGPIYIRLAKGGDEIITKSINHFKIGKAVSFSERGEILLIGCGITSNINLKAKKLLENHLKKSCGILHFNTIAPFDEEAIIKFIKGNQPKLILSIEEHILSGGLSNIVTELLQKNNINIPLRSIGLPKKKFIHKYGSQEELLHYFDITPENILDTCIRFFNG